MGGAVGAVEDPKMNSSNFSVVESEVGGNGDEAGASTNYNFQATGDAGGSSLGANFAGDSASANYQTSAGFNTHSEPTLTFNVTSSGVNLGVISSGTISSATATFNVIDYTSYGYTVTLVGSSPSNGGHQLTALTTDTDISLNTTIEQFGINLVANAHSPSTVGANPAQDVSTGVFSYGVAGNGTTGTYGASRPYTIADKYRFNTGETIASSPKSSGQTDYTMTMAATAHPNTPAGHYSGNLTLVTVATY
jgi:hypothetical protein